MVKVEVEGKSVEELEQLNAEGLVDVKDIPEYRVWQNMKQRSLNPNNPGYRWYGARGITVYKDWQDSFWTWFRHIGRRPKPWLSQDRIDNDGDYRPGNVRWTTHKVQVNNQREDKLNKKLTWEDVEEIRAKRGLVSQSVLAEDYGVGQGRICTIQRYGDWHRGADIPPPPKLRPGGRNGSANNRAIINEAGALLIKMLLAEGRLTHREIAGEAGISAENVSAIKHNRSWTHVQLPENWREELAKLRDAEREQQRNRPRPPRVVVEGGLRRW
jgi:hypothetical protein